MGAPFANGRLIIAAMVSMGLGTKMQLSLVKFEDMTSVLTVSIGGAESEDRAICSHETLGTLATYAAVNKLPQ